VMEAAVGKRTAEALVEEQEGDVHAFRRQAVSVVAAIALEQICAPLVCADRSGVG
jgi:hypothetical protein